MSKRACASVIEQTQADELIVTAQIFDHAARLRSFEITAQAHAALGTSAELSAAGKQGTILHAPPLDARSFGKQ